MEFSSSVWFVCLFVRACDWVCSHDTTAKKYEKMCLDWIEQQKAVKIIQISFFFGYRRYRTKSKFFLGG